jgi:transposase
MDETPSPMIDTEDSHTITRMSVREKPVEVITRGERRRVWTDAQKHETS